ncbi:MAG TPA: DUF4124 domain-containing protein [Geobacteraceae bacterium]
MRLLIALFVTMFAFTAARAEVYEWVDGQGVVHFTDNADKVPTKYRKKVKIIETAPPAEKTAPPARDKSPAASKKQPSERKAELLGGHDEGWWRQSFRQARAQIKVIQDQLPGKKDALAALHRKRVIYQRARDRVAYNDMADEIAKDEEKIKTLQESLAAIEADADKAGVPHEWRQ